MNLITSQCVVGENDHTFISHWMQ